MNTQEKQEAIEAIIESKKLALPWGKSREQYGAQQASHHQLLKKIASMVDEDHLFKRVLVKTEPMIIGYLPEDSELINLAVITNPAALRMLSGKWKNNDELVGQALTLEPSALQFASERIRNDPVTVAKVAEDDLEAAERFMGSNLKGRLGYSQPFVQLERLAKAQGTTKSSEALKM